MATAVKVLTGPRAPTEAAKAPVSRNEYFVGTADDLQLVLDRVPDDSKIILLPGNHSALGDGPITINKGVIVTSACKSASTSTILAGNGIVVAGGAAILSDITVNGAVAVSAGAEASIINSTIIVDANEQVTTRGTLTLQDCALSYSGQSTTPQAPIVVDGGHLNTRGTFSATFAGLFTGSTPNPALDIVGGTVSADGPVVLFGSRCGASVRLSGQGAASPTLCRFAELLVTTDDAAYTRAPITIVFGDPADAEVRLTNMSLVISKFVVHVGYVSAGIGVQLIESYQGDLRSGGAVPDITINGTNNQISVPEIVLMGDDVYAAGTSVSNITAGSVTDIGVPL